MPGERRSRSSGWAAQLAKSAGRFSIGTFLFTSALCATVAQAGEPQVIYALHPLNVVEASSEAEVKHLRALFEAQIQKLGLETADPACVADYLRARPGHSCEADEACLVEMGKQCHAQRAMWVSVAPNSSRAVLMLSGIVVRSDALAGSNDLGTEVSKGKGRGRDALLSTAFSSFLQRLTSMGFAPPTFPTPATGDAPVKAGADVATPSVRPSSAGVSVAAATPPPPGGALRKAGCITASVGVAALVTSGIVALSAKSDRDQLNSMLDANHQRPNTAQAASLSSSLSSKSTVVNVALVGGAALTVAGSVMAYLGKREVASTQLNVALVPGPHAGALVLGGGF